MNKYTCTPKKIMSSRIHGFSIADKSYNVGSSRLMKNYRFNGSGLVKA